MRRSVAFFDFHRRYEHPSNGQAPLSANGIGTGVRARATGPACELESGGAGALESGGAGELPVSRVVSLATLSVREQPRIATTAHSAAHVHFIQALTNAFVLVTQEPLGPIQG